MPLYLPSPLEPEYPTHARRPPEARNHGGEGNISDGSERVANLSIRGGAVGDVPSGHDEDDVSEAKLAWAEAVKARHEGAG
jgi:hypothetical protein